MSICVAEDLAEMLTRCLCAERPAAPVGAGEEDIVPVRRTELRKVHNDCLCSFIDTSTVAFDLNRIIIFVESSLCWNVF